MPIWHRQTAREIRRIRKLAQDPMNTRKKIATIVSRSARTIERWAKDNDIDFASGGGSPRVTANEIEKLRVLGQDPRVSKSDIARRLKRCHLTVARVAKREGILIACKDARNTVATPEILNMARQLGQDSSLSESEVARRLNVKRVTLRYWKSVGKV